MSGSTHALSPSISLNSPYNGASWEKWRFVWSGCGRSVPRAKARTRGAGSPACRWPPGAQKQAKTPLQRPPNFHPWAHCAWGSWEISKPLQSNVRCPRYYLKSINSVWKWFRGLSCMSIPQIVRKWPKWPDLTSFDPHRPPLGVMRNYKTIPNYPKRSKVLLKVHQ